MKCRLALLLALLLLAPSGSVHAQPRAAPRAETRGKLTKPPRLVEFVEAPYPESQKKLGRTAAVVLQIAIAADGSVSEVAVSESAGLEFDAAALEAARKFKFEPAEIDGAPAPVKITYRYEFVLKEEAPTDAVFEGTVRVRGTGEPLTGVRVELDDGQSAITDEKGRFKFEKVAPGERKVMLSRADLKPLQSVETATAGQKLEAIYEIEQVPVPGEAAAPDAEQDDMEIVVVAPKLTKQVVSTQVQADEARRVAGTQGDVLKVVENLPGVARASAGSGQIVVWGAAPQDTRVYVDGIRVPLLYHFGGLRSIMHTDLVRSVELIPGGYGAAYGRGLGGLVVVATRDPAKDRLHGSVQVDVLDASAAIQGPLSDKLQLVIAGRQSYFDTLLDAVSDEDVGEFFPIARYRDLQARARYEISDRSTLELTGLLASDHLKRAVTSPDPSERSSETRELYFDRIGLRYTHRNTDGSEVIVVPWIGRDHSTLSTLFANTLTELEVRSMNYGLRAFHRGKLASFLTTTTGFDFELTTSEATRRGSITSPAREGDPRVFGQAPASGVNADTWKSTVGSVAPYVEGDFGLADDKLHVVPGLRIDPLFTSVNRRIPTENDTPDQGAHEADVAVEPRLSVRYSPIGRVTFKAAYGRYRQPPLPDDLSSVFGNPALTRSAATHWLAGASVKIGETLTLENTVFYTRSEDLAVRNPSPAPALAQALVNAGEGRTFGAQFLIRRELADGFFGWIAATILRSERLDAPGGDWRLFDFDQTHVLTALASYELGAGFDVGARFRYATGFPRTPVIGRFYDTHRSRFESISGTHNTERIPDFYQLDLRASKRFRLGGTRLEIYLDVQNVTNRENAEEIAYSADFSQKRFIHGLPTVPVLGANWEF